MRIKPHGLWYILPVTIIGIGFFVIVFQFFNAIFAITGESTTLELDQVYEVEMKPDTEIALYIEKTILGNYDFYYEDDMFLIDYTDFFNEETTIEVSVQKVSNGNNLEGFEFEVTGMSDVEPDDEIIYFANILIEEQGSYQVVFHSEELVDLEFGATPFDASGMTQSITEMGLTVVLTFALSIISFFFILIKRSKSKKVIYQASDKNNYSNEYYAELERKRIDSEKYNQY